MKQILVSLLIAFLAMFSVHVYALQETPVASTVRTSTATSSDMYIRDSGSGPRDVGIIVHASITSTTGTATLTPRIEGKSPQGAYYTILDGAATTATGVITLMVRPGITAVANSQAAVPLPPVFRVRMIHSSSQGTSTYSIGVSRTN